LLTNCEQLFGLFCFRFLLSYVRQVFIKMKRVR